MKSILNSLNRPAMLLVLWMLWPVAMNGQTVVFGCTDPNATNYNPEATTNDGTCLYPTTVIELPMLFELPNAVKESSGLAFFNGKLWTFNDSGGQPILYAVDTISGNVTQKITLAGASNVDWEDITTDDDFVYVADVGNNDGNRTDLTIYKVLKSSIPVAGNSTVQADRIFFVYEDQYLPGLKSEHNFDCEAIVAAGDSLYLFTKNRADQRCNLYCVPKTPGSYTAKKLSGFNSNGLITGADFDPEARQVVLTGYSKGTYVPFLWILWDFPGFDFLKGNKRRFELVNLLATQTEGVAFYAPFRTFVSAEKSSGYSARVFRLNTSMWTGFTSLHQNIKTTAQKKMELIENPVKDYVLKIKQMYFEGQFRFAIFDSYGRQVCVFDRETRNSVPIQIDLHSLRAGFYLITATSLHQTYYSSFILP